MIAAIVDELEPKPENKEIIKKSFEWMKYHKVLNLIEHLYCLIDN